MRVGRALPGRLAHVAAPHARVSAHVAGHRACGPRDRTRSRRLMVMHGSPPSTVECRGPTAARAALRAGAPPARLAAGRGVGSRWVRDRSPRRVVLEAHSCYPLSPPVLLDARHAGVRAGRVRVPFEVGNGVGWDAPPARSLVGGNTRNKPSDDSRAAGSPTVLSVRCSSTAGCPGREISR